MELHQSAVRTDFTFCLSYFHHVILMKDFQILNHVNFTLLIRQRCSLARGLSLPLRSVAERVRHGTITKAGIVLKFNW